MIRSFDTLFFSVYFSVFCSHRAHNLAGSTLCLELSIHHLWLRDIQWLFFTSESNCNTLLQFFRFPFCGAPTRAVRRFECP